MQIKLENISFSYGKRDIIKNLSLEINKGERVALTAESGKGKTTVARLVLGLEKPNSGKIYLPQRISAVFQEDRLFPAMDVIKNIDCVNPEKSNSYYLLERAGLSDISHKKVWQLSGGMKRRIAILRALNFDAEALVLDEPFNGLDYENKTKMANLILEVYGDKPILIISHSKEDAELLGAKTINI